MSEQITLDGEYVTRDGREHRLFVVDARFPTAWPVRGEVKSDKGEWLDMSWNQHGKSALIFCRDYDLLPKPKRRMAWGWCYSPYRSIEELVERSGGCEVPVRVEFVDDKPVSIELAVIPAGLEAEGEGKA